MLLQSGICKAGNALVQGKGQHACSFGPPAGTLCRTLRKSAWHTYAWNPSMMA